MMDTRAVRRLVQTGLVFCLLVCSSFAAYHSIHSFDPAGDGGRWPSSGVVLEGGDLYGLTAYGGVSNCGTFFRVETNSGTMTVLYRFEEETGCFPLGSLCEYDSRFYGLTARGGSNDLGVIFSLALDGSDYTLEHTFDEVDPANGAFPWGGFVENAGVLYGMTYRGGVSNQGVVMSFDPTAGAYTNLHSFQGGVGDGRYPQGNLIVSGGRLYGMTPRGGADGHGMIFGIDFDGSNFNSVYEFTGGSDGVNPSGSLLAEGNWLYGMCRGASGHAGSVWAVGRLTGSCTVLHTFTGTADNGADPYGTLIKRGGSLYGMTRFGGANSQGVVFRLGGVYSNLHHFANGGEPYGDLLVVNDTFYGMAFNEGDSFQGSIFEMDIPADDDPVSWSALTWIDEGTMGENWLGDENQRVIYAQHNTTGGVPDSAYAGYGRTVDSDDATWTWVPMTKRDGLFSDHYEYTGTLGRVSITGDYVVAVKFVKGMHVYYTQSGFGSWGDWNTTLYATNQWTLKALTAPSGLSGSYAVSSNTVNLNATGDGTHWMIVFRKEGADPVMTLPVNETYYAQGTEHADQGLCVYRGDAGPFSDTNVTSNTNYRYAFYTENWNYYSATEVTDVDTSNTYDPEGDDNANGIPNWWEMMYFGGTTNMDELVDGDGDGMNNGGEYVAGTDPTDGNDVLRIETVELSQQAGALVYGSNLLANSGYESGSASWSLLGNTSVNTWKPRTDAQNGILTGIWHSNGANYATVFQKVAATPGVTYRGGGWIFRENIWNYASVVKLEFLNSSDGVLSTESTTVTTISPDTWQNVLMTGTAPANTAYAQVIVEATGIDGNDGTFYMDDMVLQAGTPGEGEGLDLSWIIKTGRVYRVDYKNTLPGVSWLPIQTNITSASELTFTLSDTNMTPFTRRLYRIGATYP